MTKYCLLSAQLYLSQAEAHPATLNFGVLLSIYNYRHTQINLINVKLQWNKFPVLVPVTGTLNQIRTKGKIFKNSKSEGADDFITTINHPRSQWLSDVTYSHLILVISSLLVGWLANKITGRKKSNVPSNVTFEFCGTCFCGSCRGQVVAPWPVVSPKG